MDARCPRKLAKLPCTACPEGRKAVDAARQGKKAGCDWFVADPEANFCFFKYMSDDGQAIPTHRIARLLMIDDNEVKRVIQSFRRKIVGLFGVTTAEEFLDQ
jgi:hypothetical protein